MLQHVDFTARQYAMRYWHDFSVRPSFQCWCRVETDVHSLQSKDFAVWQDPQSCCWGRMQVQTRR